MKYLPNTLERQRHDIQRLKTDFFHRNVAVIRCQWWYSSTMWQNLIIKANTLWNSLLHCQVGFTQAFTFTKQQISSRVFHTTAAGRNQNSALWPLSVNRWVYRDYKKYSEYIKKSNHLEYGFFVVESLLIWWKWGCYESQWQMIPYIGKYKRSYCTTTGKKTQNREKI